MPDGVSWRVHARLLAVLVGTLLSVMFLVPGAVATSTSSPVDIAAQVVDDLLDRRFDDVVARFDDQMRAALPVAELRDGWDRWTSSGDVVRDADPVAFVHDGLDIVETPFRVGARHVRLRLVFDDRGMVTGLWYRGDPPVDAVLVGVLLLGGLAIVAAATAGARGSLPRNRLVGIRLPSTMRSDVAWDVAHGAAGRTSVAAGLVLATGGVWVALGHTSQATVITTVLAATGIILVAAVQGHLAAKAVEPGPRIGPPTA